MIRIAGASRRVFMASGISAAALFASSCTGRGDSQTAGSSPSSSSPSSIEDYPRCGQPPDQPTIDYAVVTDPAFAGGADPRGKLDSSPAIRAAVASGKPVYIPPGAYNFLGPGIDHRAPFIVGAGQGATTVALGPDTTFIDSNQLWTSLTLRGIRFNGGKGHVKNRFESANVTDYHVISDCAFINYSDASISKSRNHRRTYYCRHAPA